MILHVNIILRDLLEKGKLIEHSNIFSFQLVIVEENQTHLMFEANLLNPC